MAGIHVLETGKIEPNIRALCKYFNDSTVLDLVDKHQNEKSHDFTYEELEKYDEKMRNYFVHIDVAAQESTVLFHDDGSADQRDRQTRMNDLYFEANDIIMQIRLGTVLGGGCTVEVPDVEME